MHTPLRQLASAAGIDAEYIGWTGAPAVASDVSLIAVLQALQLDLGFQLATSDDARGALADLERARWSEIVPPVVCGWNGEVVVPFAVPASRDGDWEVAITSESGRHIEARGTLFGLPADSHAWPDGQVHCIRRARIQLDGELGYHQLTWRCHGGHGSALAIAAPERCFGGPGSGGRRWGVFAPVYGLATARSGEAGDLGSLRSLFDAVSARGGRYVATLPILAAFLDEPCAFSPYSPASRYFWNELYLDLDDIARELAVAPPVAPAFPATNQSLIHYRDHYRWRRAAFDAMVPALTARHGAAIEAWAVASGVYDYAAFRAIGEQTRLSWRNWPAMWRDEPPMIARRDDCVAFGAELARVDHHVVAQWAMQRQLAALHHGTPNDVGLYLDLPVGVSLDAYEVWRHRELFLTSLAAGAPPDPLFLAGQNWGLPPLSPAAMRRDHYRYVIRCIRHHMAVAGMLRIDHVMGLFRLYVIPHGRPATDGVYLRYHAEDMLAILALESQRARCELVGEDLGVVPDQVRPAMARHGLYRIHVGQWYLPQRVGERPGRAPAESIAGLNTHDTATFAGWWRGVDIDDKLDLKLIDDNQAARERGERESQRAALSALAGAPGVEPALVAAVRDLATGPAEVVLVSLDDIAHEEVPHNVPGTTTERPNWQRRVDEWERALDSAAIAAVRAARPPG